MKTKISILSALLIGLSSFAFTSCSNDDDNRIPITYSVNSGSDLLKVFVYDPGYRDANKCVPAQIRNIPAKNGIYETTIYAVPGEPLGLFVVHKKNAGDIGKVVIKAGSQIVHRSETNKHNSLSFTGTVGYHIKRNNSKSSSTCDNPLMEKFSDKYLR